MAPNINTADNQAVPLGATTKRLQETGGSGQFNAPLVIIGIRLRSAVATGPVSFNYASFKVTVSSTHAYPKTISGHELPSSTYAANVGPDPVAVYNAMISGSSPG